MTSDPNEWTDVPPEHQPRAGEREPQEAAAPGPVGADESRASAGDDAEPVEGSGVVSGDSEAEAADPAAELSVAQAKVAGLTDDLKRLQAEYVNYKRRVDRDRELVKQNATFSVLSAMLPVLDDLDRAREHGELEGGFKAVADSLERIVAAQGLVKFGKPGDEFDPRYHEALMHSHSADVTTTTCQNIISAGYQIGERVVRPARVTVVDPEPAATDTGAPAEQADQAGPADGGTGAADRPGAEQD